jgi:hypothetical protein
MIWDLCSYCSLSFHGCRNPSFYELSNILLGVLQKPFNASPRTVRQETEMNHCAWFVVVLSLSWTPILTPTKKDKNCHNVTRISHVFLDDDLNICVSKKCLLQIVSPLTYLSTSAILARVPFVSQRNGSYFMDGWSRWRRTYFSFLTCNLILEVFIVECK